MSQCEFEHVGGVWKCGKCGHESPAMSNAPPKKNCRQKTLTEKAASVSSAMVNFASQGFKLVSRETLTTRLTACQSCEKLERGTCLECGCVVSIKARMGTEGCPLKKWYAVG